MKINNIAYHNGNASVFVLTILVLTGLIISSIYYIGPSGQTMDIVTFIKLWAREILIIGFILAMLIIVGVERLRKIIKQQNNDEQNTP